MDLEERYSNLFKDYLIKLQIVSSGFSEMLFSSNTRDEIQKNIDIKNEYSRVLNELDNLVKKYEDKLSIKTEIAELRDDYLNKIIKKYNFESILEKERHNTK